MERAEGGGVKMLIGPREEAEELSVLVVKY